MPDGIENKIGYLNGVKIGDIYGDNYIEISNAGVLSFHGTAKIDDESSSANEFTSIIIDGTAATGIYVSGAATTGIKFDHATTQRAIDIQITPTTADRQLYMDIDFAANSKEAAYIISSSAKTSGETTAVRARGQGKAAGSSTAEIRGVHGQGIAYEALYSGTVNAIYAEAIAKGTSTVTTIRGLMIACDSEGTPTAIGTMIGAHIRVKTSVTPGTAFKGLIIENEKFGTGNPLTSFIDIDTTTFTGGETIATDIISTANCVGTVTNILNYSTVTATSFLYSDATITNFLETSADSVGGAGATRSSPNQTATCDGSIVVKIGSKTLLIPLYNAVTIA